jgi:hypothetical protein
LGQSRSRTARSLRLLRLTTTGRTPRAARCCNLNAIITTEPNAFTAAVHDRTPFERRYREVIEGCRDFAPRRNEIAHGTVCQSAPPLGSYLEPLYYNSRKGLDRPAYRYSSKEVMHHADHFAVLKDSIPTWKELVNEVRYDTRMGRTKSRPQHP